MIVASAQTQRKELQTLCNAWHAAAILSVHLVMQIGGRQFVQHATVLYSLLPKNEFAHCTCQKSVIEEVSKNLFFTLFVSLSAQNSMEPVDKPRTEKAHTFLDLSIDAPRSPLHEDKNQVVKCYSCCGLTFWHAVFLVLHARIFASISVTLSFLRLRVCAWWCFLGIPLSRPPSPRASLPPSAVFL